MSSERIRQHRVILTWFFFGVLMAGLTGQLFRWQCLKSVELADRALRQRSYQYPLELARGSILDRSGLSLTDEVQQDSVVVYPALVEDKPVTATWLARVLGLEPASTLEQLQRSRAPFRLQTGITPREKERLAASLPAGVIVVTEKIRYGQHSLARHAIGAVNLTDNRGIVGLEKTYDPLLRRSVGTVVVALVDANKNLIPQAGYRRQESPNGAVENLELTLDRRLQAAVEEVMDRQMAKGAVVVIHPGSGQILALASRPNFDQGNYSSLIKAANDSVLNRAVSGYPAGLGLDLVLAAALLEEGLILPEEVLAFSGLPVGGESGLPDSQRQPEEQGALSLLEATGRTGRTVFSEAILSRLSVEQINIYIRKFGCSEFLDIGLPEEEAGNWEGSSLSTPVNTGITALDQTNLMISPVQMAQFLAIIANGGINIPLRHLDGSDSGVSTAGDRPTAKGEAVISPATAQQLQDYIVRMAAGIGSAATVLDHLTISKISTTEPDQLPENDTAQPPAWFVGFLPGEDPELAIVVLMEEDGPDGAGAAAVYREIAREISDWQG